MNQPYAPSPSGSTQASLYSPGRAPPGGAYGSAAYAPPRDVPEEAAAASGYGDKALEHLTMKRGRFTAWPYVVIAFLFEAVFIGGAIGLPLGMLAGYLTKSDYVSLYVAAPVGLLAGNVGAYFVFRDRWRCIEAFSSRFCVGIMNISLMFVPLVAFVYANVRGIRKLGGT